MKISLNWLKEFIDLTGVQVDDIAHRLTMAGLEVEEIEDYGKKLAGFVVAKVLTREKHPNADKLSLCTVNDGTGDLQVVCGAPNVAAGQTIVFARIGTVVPSNGMVIKKAKIRNIESNGMICSESEIGLSEDHSGIMVLPDELVAGTPIASVLGLDDVVMEVGITPNRPDALSHLGVARDLSAILNLPLKKKQPVVKRGTYTTRSEVNIVVNNAEKCPRYAGLVIKGITVGASPEWMQRRLTACGMRPINNIVDITNYVLLELGQPLHAFDLDRLSGKKIIVDTAIDKSKFTTLDSKEREMVSSDLMISDGEKPVAVAGVMGGENSEVSAETKNILIESAYFSPSSVRKTAKRLGLSTEASYRFERGTDYAGCVTAAERAAELMLEFAGGEAASDTLDVIALKRNQPKAELRLAEIKRILGYSPEFGGIEQILKNLEVEITGKTDGSFEVLMPFHRPDLEREIDLVEEIARIYGYDNIPVVERISSSLQPSEDETVFEDDMRELLTGLGFNEAINNSMVPASYGHLYPEPVKILNPLSTDMEDMRTSLIPGLLECASRNIKVGEKDLMLFEIGHTFNRTGGGIESFADFKEEQKLCFLLTGKYSQKTWQTNETNYSLYDLKSIVNYLLAKKSLDYSVNDVYYAEEFNYLFEKGLAKLLKDTELGSGGLIKRNVLQQFDLEQPVYCFELNLSVLKKVTPEVKKFRELLKYPKMMRDVAFIVDSSVKAGEVAEVIRTTKSSILKEVALFDLFEHASLGEGKKSLAFSLTFYDENRTLTDAEVEKDYLKVISRIETEFSAKLRGN